MSTWLEQLARVKSGVWEFFRGVWSSNRDLPFHDYNLYSFIQYREEEPE